MIVPEPVLPALLIMVAVLLVVLSGANDGGVMIALGLRFPVITAGWLVPIIAATLIVVPLLLGTGVAATLSGGLLDRTAPGAGWVFLAGVTAGLAAVLVLGRFGLPTSLTLAIVGGLSGAALGAGAALSWSRVGRVLLVGAAAPVVGLLLGSLAERLARLARIPGSGRLLRALQLTGFLALCCAYAANDGQKMLAVIAIALAALPAPVAILDSSATGLRTGVLAGCAALFCAGLLWRLRRVSTRIGFGLAQVRPIDAVAAELAGSAAVLASSGLGAPVSLTQSLAGGLVGASGSAGVRRVRWTAAARIGAAWLVTLPASALAAVIIALPLRWFR